jgi:UDP:flavonoid glycosyltransferase YjiC (YdhE family)
MPTIAIVPSDVTSKRMLARRLGARLTEAGHRVVMLVDEGDPDDAADGFEWHRIPIRCSTAGVRRPWRPIALWRASRDAAAMLDTAALAEVLVEVEPDLVIVDIEEWEALILALALPHRPPLAVLCSFFEVWPIAGLGPNDPGPPRGLADRARGTLRWPWMWLRMRAHDVKQLLVGGEIDRISTSRALARRVGIRRQFTSRQWLHPFAPRDLPMLVCNALELDIPHDPRPGVVHIGSLLEPVDVDALASVDDRELAAVIERARAESRPIVLCAFGTLATGERTALMQRLAGVARLRPEYQFVIGSTVEEHADEFSALPNVHVGGWIPQRAVLAFAAAAIVHTGNATLHECVAARVPMLVHPLGVNDQWRNAARVVRHGIGSIDGGDHDDAATLAARLDAVIADEAMRARIDALAELVTRYERDGVAVSAVDDLLSASGGHLSVAARSRP